MVEEGGVSALVGVLRAHYRNVSIVARVLRCLLLFRCSCEAEDVTCGGGEEAAEERGGGWAGGHTGASGSGTEGFECGVPKPLSACCVAWSRTLVEVHQCRGDACLLSSLAYMCQAGGEDGGLREGLVLLGCLLDFDARVQDGFKKWRDAQAAHEVCQ